MPIWSTTQISFGRVFQVLPALSKIVNNDTKDIISTPVMELSTDPDAQDLKLISSSLIWEVLIHIASLAFPLGTQLLTETVVSGKYRDSRHLNKEF